MFIQDTVLGFEPTTSCHVSLVFSFTLAMPIDVLLYLTYLSSICQWILFHLLSSYKVTFTSLTNVFILAR